MDTLLLALSLFSGVLTVSGEMETEEMRKHVSEKLLPIREWRREVMKEMRRQEGIGIGGGIGKVQFPCSIVDEMMSVNCGYIPCVEYTISNELRMGRWDFEEMEYILTDGKRGKESFHHFTERLHDKVREIFQAIPGTLETKMNQWRRERTFGMDR